MQIPQKIDSKFRFVLLASQRAEQMVRGAQPRIENPSRKPTRTAMDEISQERVAWDYGPAPVPEPTAETAETGAEEV